MHCCSISIDTFPSIDYKQYEVGNQKAYSSYMPGLETNNLVQVERRANKFAIVNFVDDVCIKLSTPPTLKQLQDGKNRKNNSVLEVN